MHNNDWFSNTKIHFDHCLCGKSYINFVFNYIKKYFLKYFEANEFLYQDFI